MRTCLHGAAIFATGCSEQAGCRSGRLAARGVVAVSRAGCSCTKRLHRTAKTASLHKKALSDSGVGDRVSNMQPYLHNRAYTYQNMHSYENLVKSLILKRRDHCPVEPFYARTKKTPSDRAFLCKTGRLGCHARTPRGFQSAHDGLLR